MGQVPRVVPGYLELSFLSVKKKKKEQNAPAKEDAFALSQSCAAVSSCVLQVFTFVI